MFIGDYINSYYPVVSACSVRMQHRCRSILEAVHIRYIVLGNEKSTLYVTCAVAP